jgi:ABC-type dipeptide/oligopeptide/nickel transport system permease component
MAASRSQRLMYIFNRLWNAIFVLLIISFVIFVFVRAIPGDPVFTILGEQGATQEQYEEMRRELGLDKPILIQYAKWIGRIIQGNFGTSIITGEKVLPQVIEKFKATVELAVVAVILGSIIGIIAGLLSAVKRNTVFDHLSMALSMAGMAMPAFWMGLLLIIAFSVELNWLPISGRLSYNIKLESITGFILFDAMITGHVEAVKDILGHLILPALTLGVHPAALTARTARASMLDVLNEDYIKAGLARGLYFWEVLTKHAFRNALIPVVTVIGLQLGAYLGGSIVTETVFSWPGLGRYVVTAIYSRDYTVIQGAVLIYALVIVIINLGVDLLYSFIDPRVKL